MTDAAHADETASSTAQTVLYVEDHPVNVLLMQALFARRPQLRLLVALDCAEAMDVARREPIDLLLLDLRLPDGHGTHLLQQMRALPGLEQVPAVAVTAEDTTGVLEAGFAEIWHKPMDMQVTLLCLDRLLELPRATREAEQLARPRARAWRLTPVSPPRAANAAAGELGAEIARSTP